MREGRGFETIEAPYDAANAIADAYSRDAVKTKTVLLECLSNLVANEMFERHTDTDLLIEKLTADIQKLAGSCRNLVIVSNHFDIDAGFEDETRAYASIMDAVNDRISNIADKTVHI
jgi:adenosylcobinamide kinase/adenosylcobinamide-phosphate guanylyltransferase